MYKVDIGMEMKMEWHTNSHWRGDGNKRLCTLIKRYNAYIKNDED